MIETHDEVRMFEENTLPSSISMQKLVLSFMIIIMMRKWYLHTRQSVTVNSRRRVVYFQHNFRKNSWRGVSLNWRQFLNLHDAINDLTLFKGLKRFPLGGKLWLCYYNPIIRLQLQGLNCYFQFYRQSWEEYINNVHYQIRSFLRDGWSKHDDYQHHATNASELSSKPRRHSQTACRYKTLSRPSRNVTYENEQREKCSTLSEGDNSNIRSNFSFRRAVDEVRAVDEIEDGEFSNDGTDHSEYGDQCSTVSEDMSTECVVE